MTEADCATHLMMETKSVEATVLALETPENAAHRSCYQGDLSLAGMREFRQAALAGLPPLISRLHEEGSYHIHDLEAFGRAPNCLVIDLRRCFPLERLRPLAVTHRILGIFEFLRHAVTAIANEQSGGIGFANLDDDIAWACVELAIEDSESARDLLRAGISGFIDWTNLTRTRYGLECYYITVNLGLSLLPIGRYVAASFLEIIRSAPAAFTRPNIVFKIKSNVNQLPGSPNRDLLELALSVTAARMIPTYLLCDAAPNAQIAPERLAIAGCRTRINANLHGPDTAIGRGNLAYVTVNLPRLAWQLVSAGKAGPGYLPAFAKAWQELAVKVAEILLLRRQLLEGLPSSFFPGHTSVDPWLEPFSRGKGISVWRHGTLSIGFVGLAEAVELLTGLRFGQDRDSKKAALEIVSCMRDSAEWLRKEHRSNFTLLATSAEMAAGRFAERDWSDFRIPQAEKGFYTNSFHVPVDVPLGPIDKLQWEGPFHTLCNGGGISYVECAAPLLGNYLALEDLIAAGNESGVSYFGVNFPRDVCRECGQVGIFDICSACSSIDISRIRRVSGYLEEIGGFTPGKSAEVALRVAHF